MTQEKKTFYLPGLMDLSSYRLERVEHDESWDNAVELSPQGTIFCKAPFISSLNKPFDFWKCYKKDDLKALMLVEKGLKNRSAKHSGWVVYGGVMFMPHDPNQNTSQIMSEEFRITSFIINQLTNTYSDLEFPTHPEFGDLRPFLWHNYDKGGPHFRYSLRYTTYIELENDLSITEEKTSTYKNLNKSRRQEIRYGKKSGICTSRSDDIDLFINIYLETFNRQKIDLTYEPDTIRQILNSLSKTGDLLMFSSSTSDGKIGSMAAFAKDSKRSYYIFGANTSIARESQTGTMVLWDGFELLRHSGIKCVDLEGVNSPKRGYFKLSFGGELKPYYIIGIDGPE